jgi:hypothetical protein
MGEVFLAESSDYSNVHEKTILGVVNEIKGLYSQIQEIKGIVQGTGVHFVGVSRNYTQPSR